MPLFSGVKDPQDMCVGEMVIYFNMMWMPGYKKEETYGMQILVGTVAPEHYRPERYKDTHYTLIHTLVQLGMFVGSYEIYHKSHEYLDMYTSSREYILRLHLTPEEVCDPGCLIPVFRKCQFYFEELGLEWYHRQYR